MNPLDALTRDQMLTKMGADPSTMSTKAKGKKAWKLARKHKLTQTPDPKDARTVLYSKAEVERVWKSLKPLPRIAA